MSGSLSCQLAPEVSAQLKHLVGVVPDSQLREFLTNALQVTYKHNSFKQLNLKKFLTILNIYIIGCLSDFSLILIVTERKNKTKKIKINFFSFQMWMTSATRDIESKNAFETILKNVATFLKDASLNDATKEIVCSALEGIVNLHTHVKIKYKYIH